MNKKEYLTRRALILSVISMIFLTICPGLGQEFCDPDNLENILDCTGSRTADIAIVMDHTGSMGGTIDQMKATALDFADGLAASDINFQLGLTAYRDFPGVCEGWCGDSGDIAYEVYGLTTDVPTWQGWINGLYAGGGADWQEAVLAAMTHTAVDMPWREDAQKIAILMCDAPPHPDGDCCNQEGDTMASTISALTSNGVKVYIVAADYLTETAWADEMAGATGGRVYIGTSSNIDDILDDITQDLKCGVTLESEATDCDGDEITLCTQILGKDGAAVPYSEGNTEAWATFACDPSTIVPLTYDAATESYCARVPVPACAAVPFDVSFQGKVCTYENSQMVTVEVCNQPPDCSEAVPSVNTLWPPDHKFASVDILGVTDPNGDPITITIDQIYQDEPVDTNGDGSFTPDGQGIGTPTAQVRAERTGDPKVPGNGRVYHIIFTASDDMGATCNGEVLVNVPHDQKKPVVDDGQLYDSTVASE